MGEVEAPHYSKEGLGWLRKKLFWNFSPEKSGKKLISSQQRKEEPCIKAAPYQGALNLWRYREKNINNLLVHFFKKRTFLRTKKIIIIMSNIAIQFDHVGKLYQLGVVGTGTLSHDLNRWWATCIMS